MLRHAALVSLCLVSLVFAEATTQPVEPVERRLAEIDFTGLTLPQAVSLITVSGGINIVPDYTSPEVTYVDLDRALQGKLTNVTVRAALEYVYAEASERKAPALITRSGYSRVYHVSYRPILVQPRTRVYNVKRLVEKLEKSRPTTKPMVKYPNSDIWSDDTLYSVVAYLYGEGSNRLSSHVAMLGDRLIVTGEPQQLDQVEAFLKQLDAADAK